MSDDLIRRSDAIEALENIPTADKLSVIRVKSIMKKEDYESLVDSIRKQAPNVIVIPHNTELVSPTDRPQGEWLDYEIPLEDGGAMPIQVCSLCKTFYPLAYTGGGHRFCPNCGARMKGADDE